MPLLLPLSFIRSLSLSIANLEEASVFVIHLSYDSSRKLLTACFYFHKL